MKQFVLFQKKLFYFLQTVCLFVFNVASTARSFRDSTPIYCPLRRTWSSVNTPFPPGIEPRAFAWQSITLLLCHASSLFSNSFFMQTSKMILSPPPPSKTLDRSVTNQHIKNFTRSRMYQIWLQLDEPVVSDVNKKSIFQHLWLNS